jgi:hypothetical protein
MFQHLDDPIPLPPASMAQIEADIDRGEGLRRRRRVLAVVIPAGVAVVTAVAVAFPTWSGPAHDKTVRPAAPPTESSAAPTLDRSPNTAEPAYSACPDPVGDSVGAPDLTLVALDRPTFPFIHFHWDGTRLPATGTVEALFEMTSADGQRSRRLVVVIVDGTVVSQYVLDPATGKQEFLNPDALTDVTSEDGAAVRAVGLDPDGLGATFPASAFMPLGGGWTWTASIAVDQKVVDVCDHLVP